MRNLDSANLSAAALRIFIAGVLAMLAACSSAPRQSMLPARALAAPAAVPAREFQQVLVAQYHEREMKMLVAGRISETAVDLSAMTPQGAPLFNVHFDGTTAQIDKQIGVPDGLSPQSILEDLQLVYWPTAQLNQLWSATDVAGWQVQDTNEGRELTLNSRPIITVKSAQDSWSGVVELQHLIYGYHLTITTLSQTLIFSKQSASPQQTTTPSLP
ncbi:MAG: DUF3261 domain-containing protein [Spongiibacteraceae bacterium]